MRQNGEVMSKMKLVSNSSQRENEDSSPREVHSRSSVRSSRRIQNHDDSRSLRIVDDVEVEPTRVSKPTVGAESSEGKLTPEQQAYIAKNLPLVEHIVTRMTARFPSNYSRDDLVQTGTLGLIEAYRRFDPSMGVAFSTFAGRRIEGAVIDMLRRDDWAPRSVRALERKMDAAEQRLASRGRSLPSVDELSDALGVSRDQLGRLRRDLNQASVDSLDRITNSFDGDRSVGDNLADATALSTDETIDGRELRGYLRDAIRLLSERHRLVIVGYFLEGRSMTELGETLGVTQSRASQIKEEALRQVRSALEAQFSEAAPDLDSIRARRQAAYNNAVATSSSWQDRVVEQPLTPSDFAVS